MFAIDQSDPLPIYAQLDRAIRLAVATGKLRRGEQLPTVRQLAVDLRINANTVAKVYAGARTDRRCGNSTRASARSSRTAKTNGVSLSDRQRQLAALADEFLDQGGGFGLHAAGSN